MYCTVSVGIQLPVMQCPICAPRSHNQVQPYKIYTSHNQLPNFGPGIQNSLLCIENNHIKDIVYTQPHIVYCMYSSNGNNCFKGIGLKDNFFSTIFNRYLLSMR